MGDMCETPEGRGKGPEIHFDSTQAMLNDPARGQRDMMNAIQQMSISAQMLHHSVMFLTRVVWETPLMCVGLIFYNI